MAAFFTWGTGGQFEFDVVLSETHEGTVTITDHPIEKGAAVSDHAIPQVFKCTIEGLVTNTPTGHSIKVGSRADVDATIFRKAYFSKDFSVEIPRYVGIQPFTPAGIIDAIGLIDNASPTRAVRIQGQGASASQSTVKISTITFDSEFDRRVEVLDVLESLRLHSTLCTVYTPVRTYSDMLIEKYSAPRNAESGGALTVSIDFRQVRIVESRVISNPKPKSITGKKQTEKGRVEPAPAAPQEQAKVEDPPFSLLNSLIGG